MKASFRTLVGRLLLRWLPSVWLAQSARLCVLALCGLSHETRALIWPSREE